MLRPVDGQHFYIDERLIDLAWIGHQVLHQTTAANYHEMHRNLRWLHQLADRLLNGQVTMEDEVDARRALSLLGYGWYFE